MPPHLVYYTLPDKRDTFLIMNRIMKEKHQYKRDRQTDRQTGARQIDRQRQAVQSKQKHYLNYGTIKKTGLETKAVLEGS